MIQIASLPPHSNYYWLYKAFENGKFEWLISNEVLAEYEEILATFYSSKTAELVLNILDVAPNVIYTDPFYKWNLIELDSDDNKFVDLALIGNADYLVTNDKDFSVLKNIPFPKVNVVNLNEFKIVLNV